MIRVGFSAKNNLPDATHHGHHLKNRWPPGKFALRISFNRQKPLNHQILSDLGHIIKIPLNKVLKLKPSGLRYANSILRKHHDHKKTELTPSAYKIMKITTCLTINSTL
jgi:hypothetical protein